MTMINQIASFRFLIFLFLIVVSPVLLPSAYADNSTPKLKELKVSLEVKELPLETVAEDIAKQTGYTVVLSETLLSVLVTGVYEDVTVDSFFSRILRGKNISILSDDSDKVIVVKLFGDKKLVAKRGVDEEKLNKLVPGMDITFEKLQEQDERNAAELEERLNDPQTYDSYSGMTVEEINEQQKINRAEMEQQQNDPNTVIPQGGGVTVGNRKKQEQLNREALEQALNDPNTVDPVSGLKMSEVRKIEKENAELLQKQLSDPDTVDPWTGSTLRELQEQAKSD